MYLQDLGRLRIIGVASIFINVPLYAYIFVFLSPEGLLTKILGTCIIILSILVLIDAIFVFSHLRKIFRKVKSALITVDAIRDYRSGITWGSLRTLAAEAQDFASTIKNTEDRYPSIVTDPEYAKALEECNDPAISTVAERFERKAVLQKADEEMRAARLERRRARSVEKETRRLLLEEASKPVPRDATAYREAAIAAEKCREWRELEANLRKRLEKVPASVRGELGKCIDDLSEVEYNSRTFRKMLHDLEQRLRSPQ